MTVTKSAKQICRRTQEMNRRIRKKAAKRRLEEAIRRLIDYALEQAQKEEEIKRRFLENYDRYYRERTQRKEELQQPTT